METKILYLKLKIFESIFKTFLKLNLPNKEEQFNIESFIRKTYFKLKQ